MEPDFSGYATKAGLKCSDGRTIMPDAFKHMDGKTVPLVWQHGHNEPANVLGHAVLEAREDGVYAYGYFNNTDAATVARNLVKHGDITNLSIYANKLVERTKQVFHGIIREVSLVLSGANPGALIDNIAVAHADGDIDVLDDEAIIYTDLELVHSDSSSEDEDDLEHKDDDSRTVKDIYESFTDEQKDVVHFMIGAALEAQGEKSAKQSSDNDDEDNLAHQEGTEMNVFDKDKGEGDTKNVLSHDAIKGIVADAQNRGSLKEAVESYALQHGINDIEVLFPDAQDIMNTPEWDKRRTEWVSGVLNGVRKTPFSRIRTRSADITEDEARAKGYIKGNLKKEEFFRVKSRITTPTTIYKKQKLDRDDIIDITDFDVVAWLKGEMRLMLDEELARAILIGDGRDVADDDKIKDPGGDVTEGAGIRAIINDHELYVTTVNVNLGDPDDYENLVDSVVRARRFYKGSGSPVFYTTAIHLAEMMLIKDNFGRKLYPTREALKAALMVSGIVEVEVMEGEADLLGIIVNLKDYALGADKGGQVAMFDDFDIDYNQYKYLIETRVSGALTKIKSAMVLKVVDDADILVAPASPQFDGSNVTIVDQTGVEYYNAADDSVMNAVGSPYAVAVDTTLTVYATPAAGYYFATDAEDEWSFTNNG